MGQRRTWRMVSFEEFNKHFKDKGWYVEYPSTLDPESPCIANELPTKIIHIEHYLRTDVPLEEFLEKDDTDCSFLNTSIPQMNLFGTYDSLRKAIGQHVKEQLAAQGLMQKDAAEILGISSSALSQIINGDVSLTLETLLMMAKKLNIRVEDILQDLEWDENQMTPAPTPSSPEFDIRPYRKGLKDLKDTSG